MVTLLHEIWWIFERFRMVRKNDVEKFLLIREAHGEEKGRGRGRQQRRIQDPVEDLR